MKKLLEELKTAINSYEYSVNIDNNKWNIGRDLATLSKCCKKVSEECLVEFNTIFDDD